MHRSPLARRLLGALAAAMAAVGLALITVGLLPGTAASIGDGVRDAVRAEDGPAAVLTGLSPVLLGARVAVRLLAHPSGNVTRGGSPPARRAAPASRPS